MNEFFCCKCFERYFTQKILKDNDHEIFKMNPNNNNRDMNVFKSMKTNLLQVSKTFIKPQRRKQRMSCFLQRYINSFAHNLEKSTFQPISYSSCSFPFLKFGIFLIKFKGSEYLPRNVSCIQQLLLALQCFTDLMKMERLQLVLTQFIPSVPHQKIRMH